MSRCKGNCTTQCTRRISFSTLLCARNTHFVTIYLQNKKEQKQQQQQLNGNQNNKIKKHRPCTHKIGRHKSGHTVQPPRSLMLNESIGCKWIANKTRKCPFSWTHLLRFMRCSIVWITHHIWVSSRVEPMTMSSAQNILCSALTRIHR